MPVIAYPVNEAPVLNIAHYSCLRYAFAMKKKTWVWRRPQNIRIALERYLQRIGKPEIVNLNRLWQHWDMVMGPDIAALAWPMGSKDTTLLLGGEDAMSMQDISYMHHEILERANAFMGCDYFTAIKVRLSLDKTPLHMAVQPRNLQRPILPEPAPLSGKYLSSIPANTSIGHCYALFVKQGQKKA